MHLYTKRIFNKSPKACTSTTDIIIKLSDYKTRLPNDDDKIDHKVTCFSVYFLLASDTPLS